MYYENAIGRFKDLLLAETLGQTELILLAGTATRGAEVGVLFEGSDEATIRQAGEAAEVYLQEVHDTDSTSSAHRLRRALINRRAETIVTSRATVEQTIRNGGALLQLTVKPADTSAYYACLSSLSSLNGYRTAGEEE